MNTNIELIKVEQSFEDNYIENIEEHVQKQITKLGINIKPGMTIAIATGSRGVSNISRIVKATVDTLQAMGAKVFIVPAMGSHGGATAEGQKQVLESYGISQETMGVEIRSSMEVVELDSTGLPNKVYLDKNAYQSDGIVIINRIKAHTDFHGPTESGLMKMCVIGLGKHAQALEIHSFGVHGLRDLIPSTARRVLESGKILFGLGIVENAFDHTNTIKALLPNQIEEEEKKLLIYSKSLMPKFPFDKIDILIVDEMGKNVSGTCLDTNVIGRIDIAGEEEPTSPSISRIIVSDITKESHGNALGMGLADFITKKLFDQVDLQSTYENVVTSTFTNRGKIPIIANDDKQALLFALRSCGVRNSEELKIVRIKNTLALSQLYVSKAYLEQIEDKVKVMGEYEPLLIENNFKKF